MSHTPTPWTIHDANRFGEFGDNGPSICAEISADTCQPLLEFVGPADAEVCRANAEFIVRCVNAHDELVAELKTTVSLIKAYIPSIATEKMEAALAKAETP